MDFAVLASLPPRVARYLRHVLREGQPIPERAELRQRGVLRTSTRSSRWFSFEAEERVDISTPGFRWDARVKLPGPLHIRVLDSYVGGEGEGQVSFLSLFRVGGARGSREMNSGALHRWLAESAWYPAALLPSERLQWSAIDDGRAIGTLNDSGISVSLEFQFNDANELTGIYTPGRWGKFGKEYRQLPWEGHFSDYVERHGTLVPARGEVGWYADGGWNVVWKGEVVDARLY